MKNNRRAFIHQSICAAMGAGAMASSYGDFARVAAAVPPADDYKALVCLFLYGGNDGDNCIIPRSQAEYNNYYSSRTTIAIAQNQLLPITPKTSDGREYAFNPNLSELQALFTSGKLAVLANVGPLVEVTTRTNYQTKRAKLPRSLFSHSDQQVIWSNIRPEDLASGTGWGGRVADLMNSLNTNPQISMSVSTAGANTFQASNTIAQYQVSPKQGSIGLNGIDVIGGGDSVSRAYREMLEQEHKGLFETEYNRVMKRAISADQIVKASLANVNLTTQIPAGYLGNQLKMIARLIAGRSSFGLKRQIFFCSLGGFDTHGDEITEHPPLLREMSSTLGAFYNALTELGVASNVTTFTASDFGRTFRANGKGSDHGWGSHHFILGDAVKGGDIYGKFPNQTINGPDDTELGRWIPTTSCDQYAATLASWFGVSAGDLTTVFPHLGRFDTANLGFMM